jgi:hypothetical protein
MTARNPTRCPFCHGTNNHSPGFDCRAQSNRQTLVDRILYLEQKVAELCERGGIAFDAVGRRR